MKMIPIQVTEEGVFIPNIYLRETSNLEVVVVDEYILVRLQASPVTENVTAKSSTEASSSSQPRRFSFIGSGHTRNPKASIEVVLLN